jgi:hypothetical protein
VTRSRALPQTYDNALYGRFLGTLSGFGLVLLRFDFSV